FGGSVRCVYETAIDDPDGEPYRHVNIDIDDHGRLNRHHLTLLPRFGAVYNLGQEMGNVYANISKGYKSGGYNTQMFSEVLQQRLMSIMGIGGSEDIDAIVGYRPEKSWNYEIGAHLWPADGLGLEAAVFYIDCRDQQLTMFPEGTTTGRMMTNAGQTRSMGAELTIHWQPAADWNLTASYGLTDARFVRFHDGREDYAGKRLPYVPANTLFVQGIYNHNWPDKIIKSLTAEVNLRGTGDIYWNEANTQRQPFYLLPGAQITAEAGVVSLSVWGRNLTAAIAPVL
ncbi:MAG: TonB-dependent receptor, partial [Muribaculaceae bacterium]|nr:TonB-dependent receptor [Muribaculaceae bacterium]